MMLPPGVRSALPGAHLPPAARKPEQPLLTATDGQGASVLQAMMRGQQAANRAEQNMAGAVPQGQTMMREMQSSAASQVGTQAHAAHQAGFGQMAEAMQASTADEKAMLIATQAKKRAIEKAGMQTPYLDTLGAMMARQRQEVELGTLAGA